MDTYSDPLPFQEARFEGLATNVANVHQYFGSDPQNSGLLLGPRSGGLTDTDLDCREAIVIAPFVLPKTAAIFGRPSARASHYLYYTTLATSVAKSKIAFQDPISRTTLLEIRIGGETGAQTIGPGSTHETGEPIDWEDNGDPTRVDDGELIRCVRLAAVASLFARYYPQEGARHDAALALGGFLSRAGLAPSWVRCVVEGIACAARDAEFVNRRETAFDAATAFHAGKNAFGIPGLSKFFEQRIVSQVAEWLDYPGSRDEQTKLEEGTPAIVWRQPSELPASLRPVAPFDFHFLPETIVPWVRDISDRMQCPADFVAVSAITALGAALGRKIGVRPQRQTDWFEVPNFWACIVGRPGAMKSPAMVEALRPLSLLEAEAHAANQEAMKQFAFEREAFELKKQVMQKRAKTAFERGEDIKGMLRLEEPEEPKSRRFMTNDCTYEALGEILAHNPYGILVHRDELTTLLKTLDREEHVAARGFFLTAWNGTSGYDFDRIIRGRVHVDAVCVSLLGSTQPGKLAEYIQRAIVGGIGDDGLIQRFGLLVWPDQSPGWTDVDRPPDRDARQAAYSVFRRLANLTPAAAKAEVDSCSSIPFLRFDDAAQDRFCEWRRDLERRIRSEELHPALEGHLSKYRKLVPALALINHLVDHPSGDICEVDILRAIAFSRYLEAHALRAYSAGSEAETMAAKAILKHIRKGELPDPFTARDIHQRGWSNLTDREQLQCGLDLLADHDWILPENIRTAGRPKTVYHINPRGLQ